MNLSGPEPLVGYFGDHFQKLPDVDLLFSAMPVACSQVEAQFRDAGPDDDDDDDDVRHIFVPRDAGSRYDRSCDVGPHDAQSRDVGVGLSDVGLLETPLSRKNVEKITGAKLTLLAMLLLLHPFNNPTS